LEIELGTRFYQGIDQRQLPALLKFLLEQQIRDIVQRMGTNAIVGSPADERVGLRGIFCEDSAQRAGITVLKSLLHTTIISIHGVRYDFYWMAFITVSGEPATRHEELARIASQRLRCELVTEARLADIIGSEFGAAEGISNKAWPHLALSILAKLGTEHHLVVSSVGAELLFRNLPGILRVHVTESESRRLGNLMLDRRLEREEAKDLLGEMQTEQSAVRKHRFGRAGVRFESYDLVMNGEALAIDQMADVLEAAVKSKGMLEAGLFSLAAEAQLQFQVRLKLARFGIVPPDRVHLVHKEFGHPSEQVFANLLDYYRIAWEYEPRSFPLQWDKDGKVLEAFTPDFYLPEFDLYVELTTMKQANVTKKNRKIRLLRAIYPHVNIQVFYQKDVRDLVIKYGLPERLAQ